jgi:hypothetical protein
LRCQEVGSGKEPWRRVQFLLKERSKHWENDLAAPHLRGIGIEVLGSADSDCTVVRRRTAISASIKGILCAEVYYRLDRRFACLARCLLDELFGSFSGDGRIQGSDVIRIDVVGLNIVQS